MSEESELVKIRELLERKEERSKRTRSKIGTVALIIIVVAIVAFIVINKITWDAEMDAQQQRIKELRHKLGQDTTSQVERPKK